MRWFVYAYLFGGFNLL